MIDRRTFHRGASRLVVAGAMAGLALAGCKPSAQQTASSAAPPPLAALPLSTAEAPPLAPAPLANDLPPARRARIGRLADASESYAFADRAYAMNSGFGDAPPDYTFDYGDGERPWVWRGDDGSLRVVEPLPDGGDRYYYYEAGADAPYLVRDPQYSYGYDNGALVVIYDSQGRTLPPDDLDRRADLAGRFLARARAVYDASQRDQREAVAQANWSARRNAIAADRDRWAASQAADPDWRAYHDEHQQQDEAQWADERYRREAEAARFAEAINDQQQAQQDWQAARRAQAHAAGAGPQPAPQPQRPDGLLGFGPKPQPPAPLQANQGGVHASDNAHKPPQQVAGGGQTPGHPKSGFGENYAPHAEVHADVQTGATHSAPAKAQALRARPISEQPKHNAPLPQQTARKVASTAPTRHGVATPPPGAKHSPRPRHGGPEGDHPPGDHP